MKPKKQVIDETGAVHTLLSRAGAGGQGEVWLVEGGRRIVKLLSRRGQPDVLRRQFAFVRRLDLAGLHVARPIAVLKPPHVGYVAEFLQDMEPLGSLIKAPATGLLQWHIETGGLRRRLRLLAHAGEALAGLHARGVIYADVSHHNVFVSRPVTATESWLIDLDNLSHESDPRRAIHTPGYGAPEIVAGTAGCTTLSDAWAFAVLVYQSLTLGHPFVGDWVDEEGPEQEERAYAGELPWVGCSTDDRNVCTSGLPVELVLGQRLLELARQTFEAGLEDRTARTTVSEWVERLHSTADQTINCPNCGGSYFVTESACSWCDEPRPVVVRVRMARWQPGHGIVEGAVRIAQLPLTSSGVILPRRITEGVGGPAGREGHVELALVQRGVAVRALGGRTAWVADVARAAEETHPVEARGRIVPRNGWMVFFEEPSRPQRVALIGRLR